MLDNLVCRSILFEIDGLAQPIVPGQLIDDEYSPNGVTFDGFACVGSAYNPATDECRRPRRSRAQPTDDLRQRQPDRWDFDLGAPNENCPGGGPGISGTGNGGPGDPGENCNVLDNVLIISEDGDSGDPDDNGQGGVMDITFSYPVFVEGIGLLDAEEATSFTLTAFDALGSTVNVVNSQALGDNSFQRLSVDRSPIGRLLFELPGSGSLTDLTVCYPPAAIGNRVWLDENSDGLQDEGEPGIPNVAVELWQDTDGDAIRDTLVATTVTDAAGGYLFDKLAPGTYYVDVLDGTDGTANTLPAGLTQTPPSTNPNSDFGNQNHSGVNGYSVTVGPSTREPDSRLRLQLQPGIRRQRQLQHGSYR